MSDPWQHRSKGMKCETCMWYAPKANPALGRCRRHSPTMSGYPVVYPNDWCGDHKLDEDKVDAKTPAQGMFIPGILNGIVPVK